MAPTTDLHADHNMRVKAVKIAVLFLVLIVAIAVMLLMLSTAPAFARTNPVAAGDAIEHGSKECTLGYVYRVQGHTMGVSAGHCADPQAPDSLVRDKDARVQGRSVSVTYIPGPKGGPPQKDWWLIDFGDVPWSDRIANTNYRVLTYVNAATADRVCYWGSTTQQEVCGTVTTIDNPIIEVTQTGRSGDSGGPAYLKVTDTDVAVVGLWQGHFTIPQPGGYVVSLPAALSYLRDS